ncbi:MAG: hypothetical protein OK449_02715 [Thaumarchaeota archaeon]|nr:hypothetical protein [Nitrososphaerota archaeon]
MPKKAKKDEPEAVLDIYERWLRKQPVKDVKARPGFISGEE